MSRDERIAETRSALLKYRSAGPDGEKILQSKLRVFDQGDDQISIIHATIGTPRGVTAAQWLDANLEG